MSNTIRKRYIKKKDKGSGEYEDLHLEGIKLLQELSSTNWTDYNEHDPGLTIFENIAYTLTNLSFKTDLPINDILTEGKGDQLSSGDNGFYIPSEILTTNPITSDDYRKVFIDRITNVKNVWLKPQNTAPFSFLKTQQKTLNGIYTIFVEMYSQEKDPDELQIEKDRIIKKVKRLFYEKRNLCEDLANVFILTPFKLRMILTMTLENGVNSERILAKIYYLINDYLSHDVKFHSLWELQEKGKNINSIFKGPHLENGFIENKELLKKRKSIKRSEILRLINKEKEVISIEIFELFYKENDEIYHIPFENNNFSILENEAPILLLPKKSRDLIVKFDDSEYNKNINDLQADLIIRDDGIEFKANIHDLLNEYSLIVAKNYGNFKSVSKSINTINIPKGANLEISSYHSIRKQFPEVYGIGDFGLPDKLPELRYAQAKQLKAYLLPIDQLMNNFLAQLTNIYTLYNSNSTGIQSFFYKELSDMPNLIDLIKTSPDASVEDSLEHWENTLDTLNGKFDTSAIERLNQVADNLLARFSETFPVSILRKINSDSYGKKNHNSDFEKDLLFYKRKLISNYFQLSYNRSKGYDYTQPTTIEDNRLNHNFEDYQVSGIVQKVAILMGIQNFKIRALSNIMDSSGKRKLDSELEGIHLIEHLLLAPPYQGNHFGFTFFLKGQDKKRVLFKETSPTSHTERNQCLKTITKSLCSKEGLIDYEKVKNGFVLQILNKEGNIIAISEFIYDTEASVKNDTEALKDLIMCYDMKDYFKKPRYYSYYGNKKVNEEFFSFQMSFVLPSQPVRFQHQGFRTKFNAILHEHAPAHIEFHSYWLDLKKLKEFEKDLIHWLKLGVNNENKMKHSYNLIEKLKEYKKLVKY